MGSAMSAEPPAAASDRAVETTPETSSVVGEREGAASPPIWLRLASTVFWLFLTLSSFALFPVAVVIAIVTWPFDRKRKLLHQFTCFWASLYTWVNPSWRVAVTGRHHVRADVPYVMVANHQSFLDILVLFRLFVHFKWVSKIENFRVPCIGWNMTLNRYIPLRRGDPESIAEMMKLCEETLADGNPIMMFPEGTRSKDGRLRPFKHGAFTLAKRMSVPILPIVVEGTGGALPKAGFVLNRGRHDISIRVLPEIPAERFADASVDQIMADVRELYLGELYSRELGER
jgi:1-acyl-sn-glycerol-3-phosphate acyltransferase